jgi:hypothetical protein
VTFAVMVVIDATTITTEVTVSSTATLGMDVAVSVTNNAAAS